MTISAIATPADLNVPDFAAGRAALAAVTNVGLFDDLLEYDLQDLIDGFDPAVHLGAEVAPSLTVAVAAGRHIIDRLEVALTGSRETTWLTVGGYKLYLSGGLSWGDEPTDDSSVIQNANRWLPESVFLAMGFVLDFEQPLQAKADGDGR